MRNPVFENICTILWLAVAGDIKIKEKILLFSK